MRYLCTYFDRRFLPRALALIESLRRWCPEFRLWALCMDEESYAALEWLALPGVEPMRLSELEASDPNLLRARESRSRVEYYFTCTPCLPLHILSRHPEVDLITYLDADLYFYSSPEPLFEELGDGSIGIIPHRFSHRVRGHERYGFFNVGWLSFRRDEDGLACLRWWRERCLEWCHARLEGDRYADQKYLDHWPDLFSGVRVLLHKGANLGPWNLASYRISNRKGQVCVDGQPLIFYHFSSFLQVAPWLYNTNLAYWGVRPSSVVRRRIVGTYIQALANLPAVPTGVPAAIEAPAPEPLTGKLARKLRAVMRIFQGLVTQDHMVVLRRQVL